MNDIKKAIDEIRKVYEVRMQEYPIRTINSAVSVNESNKPKYKALYKSLYSGNIKEFSVVKPTDAITDFLAEGEDVVERYMLVSVTPLVEEKQ